MYHVTEGPLWARTLGAHMAGAMISDASVRQARSRRGKRNGVGPGAVVTLLALAIVALAAGLEPWEHNAASAEPQAVLTAH